MAAPAQALRIAVEAASAGSLEELATNAVAELRSLTAAAGAALYRYHTPNVLSAYSGELEGIIGQYAREYYEHDECHRTAACLLPQPRLVHVSKMIASWQRSDVYSEFYGRHHMDHVLCLWLTEQPYGQRDMMGVFFYRTARQGDFDAAAIAAIGQTIPCLSAAVARGLRWERQASRDVLEGVLASDAIRPSLAFELDGRLLWASPISTQLLPRIPRLLLDSVRSLGQVALGDCQRFPQIAITIPRPGEALRAELCIAHRANGEAMIVVTLDRQVPDTTRAAQLAEQFSLTSAEARVLGYMLTGYSYPCTAAQLSVSVETIRTHSKRILSKMGARNRIELLTDLQRR